MSRIITKIIKNFIYNKLSFSIYFQIKLLMYNLKMAIFAKNLFLYT